MRTHFKGARMVNLLYYHAEFGGAETARAAEKAKKFDVFCFCFSV